MHRVRHDLVCEIREKQSEILERIAEIEAVSPNWSGLDFERKMAAAIGHTWLDVFEAASRLLRRSPAFGSARTMKASYELVRATGQIGRFNLLSPLTYRRLGLEELLNQPKGNFIDLLFGSA